MNWKTLLIGVVLFDFLLLTAYAVGEVGYVGLIMSQFDNWGGIQVITDLAIACGLAIIWMVDDARQRGSNPWPYVVTTLFAGSIGILAYLLQRHWRASRDGQPSLQRA